MTEDARSPSHRADAHAAGTGPAGTGPADADLPPRPTPGDVRARRTSEPAPRRTGRLQALAGAAVSVLGVALGIVVLQWVSEPPAPSTVVTERSAADALRPPDPTPAPGPRTSSTAPAPPAAAGTGPRPATDARTGPSAAGAPTAAAAAAPSPPPTASRAPAPSPVVPVTVLNNSRRTGLAARAAARFEAGGWPVVLTGNFRGRLPVTTVYYDPGLEVSARAFARAFDGVARVRPRFPTLPAQGLVVVVTREFAG